MHKGGDQYVSNNQKGCLADHRSSRRSGTVTGYQILRRRPKLEEETLQVLVEDTGNTDTTYTDAGVENGVKYIYKVKARNSEQVSKGSNRLTLRPPLPRPTNLSGEVSGDTISLSWDAPTSETVTGYQILRRRPKLEEKPLQVLVEDTGNTDTTYTDAEVEDGVKYIYRVAAVNGRGPGKRSNRTKLTMEVAESQEMDMAFALFCSSWDDEAQAAGGQCDLDYPIIVTASAFNATLDDDASTLDYVVRLEMLDSTGADSDACEGDGMGTDHEFWEVDGSTLGVTGYVDRVECTAGSYTIHAIVASGAGAALGSGEHGINIHD